MDFSSIPSFLDPSNWQQTPSPQHQHQHQHQQINHHHGGSSSNSINPNSSNPLLAPPPLPPPIQMSGQAPAGMGGPGGSIRPGSMAERARMANIPMPEAALKCPRCESTNTKFCYFNNYNLSQPRHFCKTCRRYWTRGGALRNVPVGGGCRRNKRSKSSSSSAAASSSKSASSSAVTSSTSSALSAGGIAGTSSVADILGMAPPPLSALRFMNNTPLHNLATDFGGGGGGLGLSGNYGGINIPSAGDLGFQLGSIGMEHWRMPAPSPPQFPFLSGLDAAAGPGMYGHPYEGAELSSLAIGHVRAKGPESSAAVKMEESSRREMSNRQTFNMGNAGGEHYNWGGGGGGGGGSSSSGNAWTDMSGLNNNSSCSTTSAL